MPRPLILDDFIPYRLSIASNVVSDIISGAYETLFGLRIPEWRLIAVLGEDGALTQQQICARTRMDKVTVSRAAIALADRGLVARTAHRADRRSHLLALTEQGRTLYADVAPKALELEGRIFQGFGEEELAGFIAMLRRVEVAALEAALPDRQDGTLS
jgi:DNA-binding MarR family transcriptional regulator